MSGVPHVLVIKLSALGDFIQAMGPFAAIRQHHPGARITLLTTKPFAAFAGESPYFDDVWVDTRPQPWDVAGVLRLRKLLRSDKFTMVYDLQTSDRSSSYRRLMGNPPWSGIAAGSSHPHANPERNAMHTVDRQAEQLAMAGIPNTPPADLGWVKRDLTRFGLPERFVLMVPGGAAHRPDKRWPAANFALLAERLASRRISTVLIGGGQDLEAVDAILAAAPHTMSLAEHTDFGDIVAIARRAYAAVGNDTGPMHLAAAAGCPSIVLFSAEFYPDLCAPRGAVDILRSERLSSLPVEPVFQAVAMRI